VIPIRNRKGRDEKIPRETIFFHKEINNLHPEFPASTYNGEL
jgi:hypothetical protein